MKVHLSVHCGNLLNFRDVPILLKNSRALLGRSIRSASVPNEAQHPVWRRLEKLLLRTFSTVSARWRS